MKLFFFSILMFTINVSSHEANAYVNYDMHEEKFFIEFNEHLFEAHLIHSPLCECSKN